MKVLVGSVRTAESQAAVEVAVAEARSQSGELHLAVHIPPPTNERDAQEQAALLERERARLEEQAERIHAESGVPCTPHFLQGAGRTSRALLDLATELAVDRIVIGTRRRSQVGKLLLGSTASDIILAAPCPVLSVKAAD